MSPHHSILGLLPQPFTHLDFELFLLLQAKAFNIYPSPFSQGAVKAGSFFYEYKMLPVYKKDPKYP